MVKLQKNLLPFILSILLFVLIIVLFQQFMEDKFYPLTYVGDTNVSFMTKAQATQVLKSSLDERAGQKLSFEKDGKNFELELSRAYASLDYSELTSAFENQHKSSFFRHLKKEVISPAINLSLDKAIAEIADSVNKAPKNAELVFDESTGQPLIQIKEAELGFILDRQKLVRVVQDALLTGRYESELPLKTEEPTVTTAHITRAKTALEKTIKKPIRLTFTQKVWTIDAKQLLTILDLRQGDKLLNFEQTKAYFLGVALETDEELQEGLFEFNPETKRVTAFKPSKEGRKLNIDKAYTLLSSLLLSEGDAIELPVDTIKPKIATSDVNNLGIKELLGQGVSNFAGSIENRIYNINLAAYRINGILIAPGETFSFNQTVGDITAATGFRKAYVIKEGRTVLDDGGGVCQVSTTVFRAALNAGLPIVKRTAHAYRVSYYEQGFSPGLDATVFYPSVDFQFKNDTPAHVLIQAYTRGTALYVDLYGSPDGRVAELTKPVITNQTPPPPDLRQDDPSLPRGTVKQVDWSAWGATVTFQRIVTRNGETLASETWRSAYKPWQAIYLVGTQ